jgi:hypothetical protein
MEKYIKMSTNTHERLLQDFWERIEGVEKVFRKKDIGRLYKGRDPPISKSELNFLYKNYTHNMSTFLSSTDDPNSVFNPDNYRTLEEAKLDEDDTKAAIREAHDLGLINGSMSRIEALAIVVKYKNSICAICPKRTINRCGCKSIRYCSKACQKSDWKNHKLFCTVKKKNKN